MATEKPSKWNKYLGKIVGTTAILAAMALSYYSCNYFYINIQEQKQKVEKNLDNFDKEQLSFCEKSYDLSKKVCNERYTPEVILECYREKLFVDDRCEKNKKCMKDAQHRYAVCQRSALEVASERLYGQNCIYHLCKMEY